MLAAPRLAARLRALFAAARRVLPGRGDRACSKGQQPRPGQVVGRVDAGAARPINQPIRTKSVRFDGTRSKVPVIGVEPLDGFGEGKPGRRKCAGVERPASSGQLFGEVGSVVLAPVLFVVTLGVNRALDRLARIRVDVPYTPEAMPGAVGLDQERPGFVCVAFSASWSRVSLDAGPAGFSHGYFTGTFTPRNAKFFRRFSRSAKGDFCLEIAQNGTISCP